ncbi:MAG: hypothetical protein IKW88_00985 [Clostridiales bacterium]|nr:hypothetical protein [Clostridiales bacterium]
MSSADLKFNQGRLMSQRVKQRAAARDESFTSKNPEMQLDAKIGYLRGLAFSQGWKVEADEKVRVFVHIIDENGEDISGAKTIQAAIDFVKDRIESKEG